MAEKGTVDLISDMFDSTMEISNMAEQTQLMQFMETASFSEHTDLVQMTVDWQFHDVTSSPGVSSFYHAHDTSILGSETLVKTGPVQNHQIWPVATRRSFDTRIKCLFREIVVCQRNANIL